MKQMMKRLWTDDEGQDIAEYALLLAVILVIVITVVTAIGTNANSIFSKAADKLGTAGQ
jgi:Flp pilus assembly pilin Flp